MCRAIGSQDYPASTLRIATHTAFARDHYPNRIAEFVRFPLNCGEIVMLGDSLTERHDWNGLLTAQAIVRNRGIAGDTTDGVLARLDEIIAESVAEQGVGVAIMDRLRKAAGRGGNGND